MTNSRQIQNHIMGTASRNAKLAKSIANYLGLSYSINNKTVRINTNCGKIANIIINNNFSNPQNFNLALLKK